MECGLQRAVVFDFLKNRLKALTLARFNAQQEDKCQSDVHQRRINR
jgi:hypothetical protein